MTARKLDGSATAAAIKEELRKRVAALAELGITPGLGTILVGDDPGSRWYVNGKHKDCAEVGIESLREDLPGTATQDEILAAVRRLGLPDLRASTHDGDSTPELREWTRDHGEYVLTNPDMLHRSMLPATSGGRGSGASCATSWSTSATTTAGSSVHM